MINLFKNLKIDESIFVNTEYGILPFVISDITLYSQGNIINSNATGICGLDQHFRIQLKRISDGWFYNGDYIFMECMDYKHIEYIGKKFALANLLFKPKF